MRRTNRADHPRERVRTLPIPTQPDDLAPLVVMQRTDGVFIVYDARRPAGQRARREASSLDEAIYLAREVNAEDRAAAAAEPAGVGRAVHG